MKEALRSFVAAGGVALGCASVGLGLTLRSRVDLSGAILTASASNSVMRTWVSSRTDDVNVPAADYYDHMVELLKQYYVEPIGSDQKLATGSVRGMIASLGDPRSQFMDPDVFKAYLDRKRGIYHGIGADLYLQSAGHPHPIAGGAQPPEDAEDAVVRFPKVPKLVVGSVVPGGPADRAGVKPGDIVSDVDGHWVANEDLLDKVKHEQELFNRRQIDFKQIAPLERELRSKIQRALLPVRAEDRLETGDSGLVTVVWNRGGAGRSTRIERGVSRLPALDPHSRIVHLSVTESSGQELAKAIKGRSAVTIDLRNAAEGDSRAIIDCLKVLAPSGTYGEFVSDRNEVPTPLEVRGGNSRPPKITLLVDRTTRGPAEILALALSSRGRAVLKGSLMGGDLSVCQVVQLADGTGYTLETGEYEAGLSRNGVLAKREPTRRRHPVRGYAMATTPTGAARTFLHTDTLLMRGPSERDRGEAAK